MEPVYCNQCLLDAYRACLNQIDNTIKLLQDNHYSDCLLAPRKCQSSMIIGFLSWNLLCKHEQNSIFSVITFICFRERTISQTKYTTNRSIYRYQKSWHCIYLLISAKFIFLSIRILASASRAVIGYNDFLLLHQHYCLWTYHICLLIIKQLNEYWKNKTLLYCQRHILHAAIGVLTVISTNCWN